MRPHPVLDELDRHARTENDIATANPHHTSVMIGEIHFLGRD